MSKFLMNLHFTVIPGLRDVYFNWEILLWIMFYRCSYVIGIIGTSTYRVFEYHGPYWLRQSEYLCFRSRILKIDFTKNGCFRLYLVLHTPQSHIQNNITQRQVKIKRRSKRDFSPWNKGFPHAFTCNPSCVDVSWLWVAWICKNVDFRSEST